VRPGLYGVQGWETAGPANETVCSDEVPVPLHDQVPPYVDEPSAERTYPTSVPVVVAVLEPLTKGDG
jgi:hypothetical protein